jgi:hypothetical protein|tara:strand:+ start:590 stop:961 length:372 start_codon:yes stop_codon:yes gene_type:complete
MVLAKKHMALDIWISPEHWRDAMAKLKHYRDMEYINSGHDISGQPEAFKSWVWQYQLPDLVQKDSAVKNQIQNNLDVCIQEKENLERQIKSIATELCLKKEEMEHKIAQYQGVLNTTKKKKKT